MKDTTMKTYEIELKREYYAILTIDAESAEQAEQLAWNQIQSGGRYDMTDDAEWSLSQIEEVKTQANTWPFPPALI